MTHPGGIYHLVPDDIRTDMYNIAKLAMREVTDPQEWVALSCTAILDWLESIEDEERR